MKRDPTIRAEHFDELKAIHALIEEAKYSVSKSRIDKALATDLEKNERAQFYNLLGYVHFLEGDFDEAIVAYEEVVASPESTPEGLVLTTHYTLAQLHFAQGRYKGALEWINTWHAVADNPGPIPTIFKAQTLFQMGRLEASLATLNVGLDRARERGHEINPKWIELRNYLETNTGGEPRIDLTSATDGEVMLIAKVQPVYPFYAEKRRLEGYVDVRFDVSAEGNVIGVRVEAAEPPQIFDAAALSAVSKYKYKPRVTGGTAVATEDLATRIDFRLKDTEG